MLRGLMGNQEPPIESRAAWFGKQYEEGEKELEVIEEISLEANGKTLSCDFGADTLR